MNRLPARAGTWLAVLACAGLLFWVADGISGMEERPGYAGHYYEYLVEGFLHGHTYLSVAPAPELSKLQDPYDPGQSAPYRLSDASYYRGRYYLYYGPTPAVLLMLPWRVVTGHPLPERWAAVIFATLALAALALLLWEIRMRYFPRLSGWAIGPILFVAMHGAWLPVLLRRPGFWELPHAAAVACLWWTLYFLWRSRSGGSLGWAFGVGAGLALLVGCRATYIFTAAVIPVLALSPMAIFPKTPGSSNRGLWHIPWRECLAMAAPLAAGACALMLYNLWRFGSVGEFGQSYQLLNVKELHQAHLRPMAFIPFNVWIYLGSLPEISPYFPFFKTVWPASLPDGYLMSEEMHGALFALPVHFGGWAALVWLWRRRRHPEIDPLGITLVAAISASFLAACILFSWFGASTRYLTELFGGWTLVTSVGLMVLFNPEPPGAVSPWRRPMRALVTVACLWAVGYVWLASFEHGGLFRRTNPVAYSRMARILDYPSLWTARRQGVVYGPVEVTVGLAPFRGKDSAVILAAGRLAMMNTLVLERTDAGHARLKLMVNDTTIAAIDGIVLTGETLDVRVEAPWLYPPAEHPYWDRFTDFLEKRDRMTRFALTCGGRSASGYSEFSFDPTRFQPFMSQEGTGAAAWVTSLKRLSAARL